MRCRRRLFPSVACLLWSLGLVAAVQVRASDSDGNAAAVAQGGDSGPGDSPVHCRGPGKPQYPDSLRTNGNDGNVLLSYDVAINGDVSNLRVLESSHPAFERAAVVWAQGVQCQAPRRGGHPVATQVRQMLKFSIRNTNDRFPNGRIEDGVMPFSIPAKAPEEIPEAYRYDVAPELRYVAPIVYPLDELLADHAGSAQIRLLIDTKGRVARTDVIHASSPAFGEALRASVHAWRFRPASRLGKPCPAVLGMERQFNINERDFWTDSADLDLISKLRHRSDLIATLAELDRVPKAIYRVLPVYPPQLLFSAKAGSAVIEFYVGADGQVRLPSIVSASEPEFGWAAATAVASWQFEPPMRHGQPVDARLRLPVNFSVPEH